MNYCYPPPDHYYMKGKGPAEKNEDEEMWYQEQSWIFQNFLSKKSSTKGKGEEGPVKQEEKP